jgi:hypothetical protein
LVAAAISCIKLGSRCSSVADRGGEMSFEESANEVGHLPTLYKPRLDLIAQFFDLLQ